MDIPKIEILRGRTNQVDFYECMKLVKESGKRMASNLEHDAILQNETEYQKYKDVYDCRTGTMMIKPANGQPFKDYAKFRDLVFDVPKEFQGKSGIALLVNHPSWDTEEIDVQYGGKLTRIVAKELTAIPFNGKYGWRETEKVFGIPNGKTLDSSNPEVRRLFVEEGEFIGPVVRWYDWVGDGRRGVGCYDRPDVHRGVGVVEPQAKPSSKRVES